MSIYNGDSKGFQAVTDGYIDYAETVIARRAIQDLRDGLKPVNRRIIYSCFFSNKKKPYMQASTLAVSDTMELHPHGDSSIYSSFALLTDKNGSNAIPLFNGRGDFGKPYLSGGPAAMRYTEFKCSDNMQFYFEDGKNEFMNMIQGEKNKMEPEVLNATIPFVLINNSSGIAVAVGTNIPSFNAIDVLNLTEKYIRNGKLSVQEDIIVPDFQTGGILVRNDTELAKIMEVGKGKLKIRAKVEIVGKSILVKEVPYGATAEGIIKKIDSAEIKEIADATHLVGHNSDTLLEIVCKTKKSVEYVLMELYRRNILQTTFSSNILVLNSGIPKILGVFGIIKEWCKWRESVIIGKYKNILAGIKEQLPQLEILMNLIKDKDSCEKYAIISIREGRQKARAFFEEFLKESGYENLDSSLVSWLAKECKNVDTLHDGDKYAKQYSDLLEQMKTCEYYIQNPSEKIIEDLREAKKVLTPTSNRKTEITYKDYKFSKITDSESIEDTSYCVWVLKKNGFLKKVRDVSDDPSDIIKVIQGQANDILIGFDNYGQVVRVVGSEIPFTPYSDNGVYLPKYFGVTDQVKDYRVLYLGELDGTTRMLVYRDGYIGFLDTSEWVDKKNTKVIRNGVPLKVMDKLLQVYEESEIPAYLMVADDSSGKIKLGIVETSSIPVRSRRSCAKVFSGSNEDIHYLRGFDNAYELNLFIKEPSLYLDKLKVVSDLSDIQGDPETLKDGFYLDLCKDLEEA